MIYPYHRDTKKEKNTIHLLPSTSLSILFPFSFPSPFTLRLILTLKLPFQFSIYLLLALSRSLAITTHLNLHSPLHHPAQSQIMKVIGVRKLPASIRTRKPKAAPTCERCVSRLTKNLRHECVTQPGRITCNSCSEVYGRCVPVSLNRLALRWERLSLDLFSYRCQRPSTAVCSPCRI